MRERTYTVMWSRPQWLDYQQRWVPGSEQLVCSGLTPRTALARLMGALDEADGPILVHKVERDGQRPRDYMGYAAAFMLLMALGYVITAVCLIGSEFVLDLLRY